MGARAAERPGEVGITDHAQEALGDLVFVEVPQVGPRLARGEACAVVESVKAASDVYSPVSGRSSRATVILSQQPELLNQDPYGAGWLMRVEVERVRPRRRLLRPPNIREFPRRSRVGDAMPFIPHTADDIARMLEVIGANSIDDLFDEIPAGSRRRLARAFRRRSPKWRSRGF